MTFTDADAQRMLRVIDERIERRAAETQARYEWGVVDSVDVTNSKCAVFLFGSTTSSPGFRLGQQLPDVGDVVRVGIDPRGDRWVDRAATAGGLRAERMRVTATDDASLSSTLHGLQVGPSTGQNIAIDDNEIMSRNNGAASTLVLNGDGGDVQIGAGSALLLGVRRWTVLDVLVPANAYQYIADASITRQGGALLVDDGNSGVGLMHWYRHGSFNVVSGVGTSNLEWRGTTYSSGAGNWSWFVENNNTGARLACKSNQGFDRTWKLFIFY